MDLVLYKFIDHDENNSFEKNILSIIDEFIGGEASLCKLCHIYLIYFPG